MKGNLIFEVEIPNYIRRIKLSEHTREAYFFWNGITITSKRRKLTSNFYNKVKNTEVISIENLKEPYKLIWFKDKKNILVLESKEDLKTINKEEILKKKVILCSFDTKTQIYKKIIANDKLVGKPNYLTISGQDIYNSKVREYTRGEIFKEIKNNFKKYIQNIKPITHYPILIEVDLYDYILNKIEDKENKQNWDVDNRIFPYSKAFPDFLKEEKIIIDDDRLHITQPPHTVYYPIHKHETPKLVFRVYEDTRDFSKWLNALK
jgi:hypothetical protein